MLLQAYLYLWTMSLTLAVFMIQFETFPVLLILSNTGSSSSSCRIRISQAPAVVDLGRSFIMIKYILQNCTTYPNIQATHKTSSSTCNVLLSSFQVRSNRTTLQTWVYRVFNHANWPIKTRHSHSLCSERMIVVISILDSNNTTGHLWASLQSKNLALRSLPVWLYDLYCVVKTPPVLWPGSIRYFWVAFSVESIVFGSWNS